MRASAVALALLALVACTRGDPTANPSPDPLPSIATDPCPSPNELLAPNERPTRGKRLPDVALSCIGYPGTVTMSALGKVPTVLNLWASWCYPCRKEMPQFQRAHFALGETVRFLGVDTRDFEREARSAIQRAGIGYASVFDKDERIKRAVGTRSLPTTVFLGADGLIKNVHVGELTETELRADIAKYLGVR